MGGKTERLIPILVILLSCVGCDQATKYAAANFLSSRSVISLSGDAVWLVYATNTGVFLSLGSSWSEQTKFWAFTIGVSVVLTLVLFYLLRAPRLSSLSLIAASLVVGGGMSNLIDRLLHEGAVIDFISLGIGDLRTGIFNLADLAIALGTVLLIGSGLRRRTQPPRRQSCFAGARPRHPSTAREFA